MAVMIKPVDLILRVEVLEEALERIEQWSHAYPLTFFPEPNLKRAAEILQANGMTLDAISAHAMRHVVTRVGEIARAALNRTHEERRCVTPGPRK